MVNCDLVLIVNVVYRAPRLHVNCQQPPCSPSFHAKFSVSPKLVLLISRCIIEKPCVKSILCWLYFTGCKLFKQKWLRGWIFHRSSCDQCVGRSPFTHNVVTVTHPHLFSAQWKKCERACLHIHAAPLYFLLRRCPLSYFLFPRFPPKCLCFAPSHLPLFICLPLSPSPPQGKK